MPAILNDIVKNDAGKYKGGAQFIPDPDTGDLLSMGSTHYNGDSKLSGGDVSGDPSSIPTIEEGDQIIVRFFVQKNGGDELALGEVTSDPVDAPDDGKQWQWFSRIWIEQAAPLVPEG